MVKEPDPKGGKDLLKQPNCRALTGMPRQRATQRTSKGIWSEVSINDKDWSSKVRPKKNVVVANGGWVPRHR